MKPVATQLEKFSALSAPKNYPKKEVYEDRTLPGKTVSGAATQPVTAEQHTADKE